jgi:hypothetical protein
MVNETPMIKFQGCRIQGTLPVSYIWTRSNNADSLGKLGSSASPKSTACYRDRRELHDEKLHDLYSSPSTIRIIKSRRIGWAGHVTRMGEKMNANRLLVGKQEGKRPLGRPRRRWVDNITMDLVEVGWSDVDWIGLAQDRDRWRAVVNSVLKIRVP